MVGRFLGIAAALLLWIAGAGAQTRAGGDPVGVDARGNGLAPSFINVIAEGAKCDAVNAFDGAMKPGAAALATSATTFSRADVGKSIMVVGAGPGGIELQTTIQAYASPHAVTLATNAGATVSGTSFVYGTDDTAALAAAIAAAETADAQGRGQVVWIPANATCLSASQTITGQLTIEGMGPYGSVLMEKGGTAKSFFVIQTSGSNYAGTGYPLGQVVFRNLRITAQGGKLDPVGQNNAYGIQLCGTGGACGATPGAVPVSVLIDDVTIYAMPGGGIEALEAGANGYIDIVDSYILNNDRNGYYCTGTHDTRFMKTVVGGNGSAGIYLSGCADTQFYGTNVFSNGGCGVYSYGSGYVRYYGGQVNDNGGCGVELDRPAAFYDSVFVGADISSNSRRSPGTAPDLLLNGGTGAVTLDGVHFAKPHASGGMPSYNIRFASGSTVQVTANGVNFDAGDFLSPNVTNEARQISVGVTMNGASTTGSRTQTFTNSPCRASLTAERWLPITIPGQSGTWYVPACH